MKNLDFKYVAAGNFLCYGPEGIELELEKYGNVILVRGDNLDVKEEEERIASNGVGKSSIPEIIVYALYGKTIKHPKKLTHKDVINNQTGKNLVVEVRWGDFRVVRTRKPDSLRLWESADEMWDDEHELTLGGMPATQALIEEKIGLNYDTFVNVMVFTDNNSGSFLECDTPTKRKIVENLLSLSKYRRFTEKAKDFQKKAKATIKDLSKDYDSLLVELQNRKDRVAQTQKQEMDWKAKKKEELTALLIKAKQIKQQLESTDEGAALARYQEAQVRLSELTDKIPELQDRQNKVEEMLKTAREKLQLSRDKKHEQDVAIREIDSSVRSAQTEIENWQHRIKELEEQKDAKCDFCLGEISEQNYGPYVQQLRNKISHNEGEIARHKRVKEKEQEKIEATQVNIQKLTEAIATAQEKSSSVTAQIKAYREEANQLNQVEKPKSKDVDNAILEKQFEGVRQQILSKESELTGESPYVEILKTATKEVEEKDTEVTTKKAELTAAEKELPYYEFWVTAFGDAGIRKFVIDGIIPALNSRVAYWLQYLIDGKIQLSFDNQLEETIGRNPTDGDPFVYHAMSGGERRRLNLAVSQAFAHVMMLNSGACPSLVFLDEVTTNIDPIGVVGIYNMIMELAKERQVFVTTHDQGLLEMLEGCETIALEKQNGFTKLVEA